MLYKIEILHLYIFISPCETLHFDTLYIILKIIKIFLDLTTGQSLKKKKERKKGRKKKRRVQARDNPGEEMIYHEMFIQNINRHARIVY